MILAAGLSPAWQRILRFPSLQLGEVNRAQEGHWCASGKVFNVAIALAQLGADCRLVSPVGRDVREQVETELAGLGVQSRLVICETPTRVCTTLIDSSNGQVTELVENAQPLGAVIVQQLLSVYSADIADARVAVLTGSLPAGTPTTFYRDLLAHTPCDAVVDARGPDLISALEARPLVVKPNREELAQTSLRFAGPSPPDNQILTDDGALVAAMRELNARGAQWVVVTEGPRAVWASSTEGVFRLEPLAAEGVVNPIGCGDCLAAGLAWGLSLGRDPLESVAIGIAAAAQNAAQLLPGRVNGPLALEKSRRVAIERLNKS